MLQGVGEIPGRMRPQGIEPPSGFSELLDLMGEHRQSQVSVRVIRIVGVDRQIYNHALGHQLTSCEAAHQRDLL